MCMLRTLSAIAISAIAFTALAGQQAGQKSPSQPPAHAPAQKPPEAAAPEAGMQDMMPGPIHEHMKRCVGEFTTVTKMTGPGMDGMEPSAGTAKITMSLDGRFLVTEEEGSMMGMPIKSMKIAGYNNGAKRFESVWMYTMSTGMLNLIGTSEDHGKSIKWKGTYKEADGEHTLEVTTTHVDENTFVERLLHADGEAGEMVMETTFTRKK